MRAVVRILIVLKSWWWWDCIIFPFTHLIVSFIVGYLKAAQVAGRLSVPTSEIMILHSKHSDNELASLSKVDSDS